MRRKGVKWYEVGGVREDDSAGNEEALVSQTLLQRPGIC